MLEDHAQLGIVTKTLIDPTDVDFMADMAFTPQEEIKYKIVMRLAERWGIEAFQRQIAPQQLCAERFATLEVCRTERWNSVTKIILTAFVIREHAIYQQFFKDVEL